MKHYYRYITDRYLFRIVISLLLAGAVTVSIIYKDLLWIVISSLLLLTSLRWQWKLYRRHTQKVLFLLDAIENNDASIHFSEHEDIPDNRIVNQALNRVASILYNVKSETAQQEKYYELILDCINTGILVLNDAGAVYQKNNEALRLLGLEVFTHVSQLSRIDTNLMGLFAHCRPGDKLQTRLSNERGTVNLSIRVSDITIRQEHFRILALNDINNELDEKEIDRETKIHIATVQSLVKRILYPEGDTMPSVTDYDLIVVDEAHRGYILDKEMSETEMLYRNQDDYISKYRTVIEYFDAVKIALTATPALHTTEIFGKPVFNYSYREAVIDGYLVDHDAPHNIRTKLRVEGINYQKGEQLAIYDPVTGEVLNSAELEDDMKFEIDSFNRQVITENFNRTVLEEIAWDFNPDGQGKTLIYAVDDNHADLIVKILKEIYADGGVDNDTVMKITGSVAGGNKKKISEAIKRFKNESLPKIVVTVDLLTTGIDVPEITTLVFMRRIKSRILFEQMLGRATRLCPAIGKTHFEIYDPVGVYESLQDVSNMKPVATNPSASFEDLMKGLEVATTDEQLAYQIDLIVAKLQRKRRNVSKKALEQFAHLTGGKDLGAFAEHLNSSTIKEATAELLGHREAFSVLDKDRTHRKRPVVIDNHEDELIDHTRGYGEGQKPEDYLEAFREFINNNINAIAALRTVCTRPSELTREALKSLKLELDRHDFTEKQLNSAWNEMTNQDIVADIIAFIRQQALGSALVGHEQRVKHAFAKLRMNHEFNKTQLEWLKRIEKVLLEESVLDEQIFEVGAFKNAGGFTIIDRRFGGKLREIMTELNEYLYDDGGSVA